MKRIPVRDPGTAIIRAVQGRSKLELAHRIWRATGLYSWVRRGVVEFQPNPHTEIVIVSGVRVFRNRFVVVPPPKEEETEDEAQQP